MKRSLYILMMLVSAAAWAGSPDSTSTAVCDTLPLFMDSVYQEPCTVVRINGQPMRMIVDTGTGSAVVVFRGKNKALGASGPVTHGSDVNGRTIDLQAAEGILDLGKHRIHQSVDVIDADTLLTSRFDGILGFPLVFISRYAIKFDLRAGQLIIRSRDCPFPNEPGDRIRFKSDRDTGLPMVSVLVDGKLKLKYVLLDTGFYDLLSIARPWYDKTVTKKRGRMLLSEVEQEGWGTGFGGINGVPDSVRLTRLRLSKVRFGDTTFSYVPVFVATDSHGLGNEILRRGTLTIMMKRRGRKGMVIFRPYL